MSFANFKAPRQGSDDQPGQDSVAELSGVELALGKGAQLPLPLVPELALPRNDLVDLEEQQDREFESLVNIEGLAREQGMAGPAEIGLVPGGDRTSEVIKVVMMRLADLLFLPAGNMPPQERSLSDDLVSKLFEKASHTSKLKLVERLLQHTEPPPILVRTMLHSEDEIALPILRSPMRLQHADLISVIMTSGSIYQKAVAEREDLHSAVCDTIIQCADVSTIRVMLRNRTATISRTGFVRLAELSLKSPEVLQPLIERTDFPPDLAQLVFWWSPTVLRRKIIERYASPRQTIFEVVSEDLTEDFEGLAPEVANALRMVRKAQRMDRRCIDQALDQLAGGNGNETLDLLSDKAHLKAETIAQIFDDHGGEPLGVFCKAVGFGRERFMRLRAILAERKGEAWDEKTAISDDVSLVHDTLSTDKADLILRYWDRATREIEI